MPIEVGIWKLNGAKAEKIAYTALKSEGLLEKVLAGDISIIDPNLLLIGRQVPTSYGKFIDLLAIDADGNLVVLELKRDRTPREVVAQLLDYGSWIRELEDEDIAGLFGNYLKKYHPSLEKSSLDQTFCQKFDVKEMPEVLNESHELVVVAGDLDDSTERIINYLSEEYGVAINAVFFRIFRDGNNEYLSRAWMIAPGQAETKAVEKGDKRPWNGEYYASFGHGDRRKWEDARKHGFIAAGGGEWYSRTLSILEPGGRVWVNIPQTGYVGVCAVLEPPVEAKKFMVENKPITKLKLDGDLGNREEGKEEYLVRVKWIKTLPIEEAVKEKGFFGNQNSAAKPKAKKWSHTVERLKKRFDVE